MEEADDGAAWADAGEGEDELGGEEAGGFAAGAVWGWGLGLVVWCWKGGEGGVHSCLSCVRRTWPSQKTRSNSWPRKGRSEENDSASGWEGGMAEVGTPISSASSVMSRKET